MRYKAVVFDMDGVIFDTERLILTAWQNLADKYKIPDITETMYQCIGVNSVVTKQIFLDRYGADFPFDTYKKEAVAFMQQKFHSNEAPLKKGVIDLLKYLIQNGYKVGLASSTRYAIVKEEMEAAGLLPYFQELVCGDMLEKSKPEPDIFLMACEKLEVAPKDAIGIEDSFNGIRSVSRAGMLPIMVPDLIKPDEEMQKLAAFIFEDLKQVLDWIKTV